MSRPTHHPFDHVGVAVTRLDEARSLYELLLGAEGSEPLELAAQGVRVCFVGSVELLEPLAEDTPVGRFLVRHGPGLHHVAFSVPDIRAELARLEAAGIEVIDAEPRPGAHGLVAFLHPRSTGGVLVELVQRDG